MASSADYLNDLTRLGYTFRYNDVTDRIEINGEPITNVLAARIRAEMRDQRHKSMPAVEDAYTAAAWANRYHPIRAYLSGLAWDGGSHIDKLASHFTDKHGIFPTYLRRFLIGAVAKVYDQSTRNIMLVLDGPTNIGKSRFAGWLCPRPLGDYFHEGPLNTDDKDTWIRLTNKWIWELSELDAITKKNDIAALKDFVTRHEVTVRRPYDKFDIVKPALASLIGTLNADGSGFLRDMTGNARYAVVTLTAIDWQGYATLAIDQIWAEAYTAYQAGEQWELTPAERQRQAEINSEHEIEPTIEGMVRKHFVLDKKDTKSWTSGMDIILDLEAYGLRDSQRGSLMALATFMKKNGIERKRVKDVWGYVGVSRKTQGIMP